MNITRICNRVFMDYCTAKVNGTELVDWYWSALYMLHKIEDVEKANK